MPPPETTDYPPGETLVLGLEEARDALARSCTFQDTLHDVPVFGVAVSQTEEFSSSDKRTRLEVKHAAALSGHFPGNAPIVLTFLLPEPVVSPPDTIPETETESPMMVDDGNATCTEERAQP